MVGTVTPSPSLLKRRYLSENATAATLVGRQDRRSELHSLASGRRIIRARGGRTSRAPAPVRDAGTRHEFAQHHSTSSNSPHSHAMCNETKVNRDDSSEIRLVYSVTTPSNQSQWVPREAAAA